MLFDEDLREKHFMETYLLLQVERERTMEYAEMTPQIIFKRWNYIWIDDVINNNNDKDYQCVFAVDQRVNKNSFRINVRSVNQNKLLVDSLYAIAYCKF